MHQIPGSTPDEESMIYFDVELYHFVAIAKHYHVYAVITLFISSQSVMRCLALQKIFSKINIVDMGFHF